MGMTFNSIMGTVSSENLIRCLWVAFDGMVGIFIVMGLICLVLVMLNNLFNTDKKGL